MFLSLVTASLGVTHYCSSPLFTWLLLALQINTLVTNVLLYQHVRSSVSSCSICPRWQRLDALFRQLPDVSLRSDGGVQGKKRTWRASAVCLRNLQQITAKHEESVGSGRLWTVSVSLTNGGLKRVSGGMIRENNNPISLFVATRCILRTNDCWEMTPKGMWLHSSPLYWWYPLNSNKARVVPSLKGDCVSIGNPGPVWNLEKTATYRIYYKKVIMRPCPSFWDISWIIMSSCTDVKDVVSEMFYAIGDSKSSGPWKHNLIKILGSSPEVTKELSRSATVSNNCQKIVMMRRTVMIEMHCTCTKAVSSISGPQNYWKSRGTGSSPFMCTWSHCWAHGCNLHSPSATKVIHMTHYM